MLPKGLYRHLQMCNKAFEHGFDLHPPFEQWKLQYMCKKASLTLITLSFVCSVSLTSVGNKLHFDKLFYLQHSLHCLHSYLTFVIFLHGQRFWRIKFTPKKRVNYDKIHSKLPFFCVITAKYTVNCQFFALNL